MKDREKFKHILCIILLVLVSLFFTSCEAFLGGDITFSYFVGCIIYGAIGLVAGALLWIWATSINDEISMGGWFVVPVCVFLPLLWRPAEKFNFTMLVVNIVLGIIAVIISFVNENRQMKYTEDRRAVYEQTARIEQAKRDQAELNKQLAKEQNITYLREQLDEVQKNLDKAKCQKETIDSVIEKQGVICRKVETFRQLVNSLANSLKKGEDYEITRYSAIESCFQTFKESEKYIPDSVLAEFKEIGKYLYNIINVKLNGDNGMSPEDRMKFTQMQEKVKGFLTQAHNSQYREKIEDSSLDELQRRILDLNNKVVSLSEQLHAEEQRDI